MKNLLKSTTSLGLSLALAFPHGAFAQDQNVPECGPVGEATEFPCAFDDQTVESEEELRIATDLSADAEASAEADGERSEESAEAQSERDIQVQMDDEVKVEGEAAVEGEATADSDAAAETATDGAADAEAAAQEAATAAEEAAAAAEAQAAEQAAAAEAQTAAEADAAAEAQAAADAAAAAEADAAAAAAAEAEVQETEAARSEESTEAQSERDIQVQMDDTATTESDAAAAQSTDTTTNADVAAEAANGEADAEAEAAMTDEELQAREERREARREERRAERRAEREAAAAAAAAAAESTTEAEVVTEEVTEEDVRSSEEEFDTKVSAAGETSPEVEEDDGLSDFEKALLLGLGAVAVGSVLNNGEKIVSRSGDRLVIQDPDGQLRVLKDDNALIRQPGDQVQTQTFDDGSTRTIVTKADGSRIETIRARDGSVLRRTNFDAQGREYVLVDDLVEEQEVIVSELPQVQETQELRIASKQDEEALRRALQAEQRADQGRTFSLRQVREIQEVRSLAPQLELDAVRFPTGSAAIQPEQAKALANIGATLKDMIQKDPRTVILVEGHTDAVGDASYNLALSDRRAETVALALTEYFDVPPANLVTQGYGESQLRVPTNSAEPANRRAVVRNISGLLR